MASSRDLPFPMMIVALLLITGYSPLPTPRVAESHLDSDYGDYDYGNTVTQVAPKTANPLKGPSKRCDYNPCLENQIPCLQQAEATSCLCPGFTLRNEAPESPDLKSVSWNGSDVVVSWCAPYSYVTEYYVTVGGEERQTFGKEKRSGGVGVIEDKSKVCVIARNDVGESDGDSELSCATYEFQDSSLPLTAGLIGGALGLLLLVLLAVLLWRHKKQKKQQSSISMSTPAESQ
ncbi:uncharacterized protein V6R79_015514 [Siganus canaliculatus]